MTKQGLDGWATCYAVRIARRLELSEREIRSLVRAAAGFDTRRNLCAGATSRARATTGADMPVGSAGKDVPVAGRVLAVIRTFQALIMTGRDREQALTQIKRRSGSHLDPEVVGTLLTIIREDTMAALAPERGALHNAAVA